MSDGTCCIIRDLGLVNGGKGLRHHECLLRLTVGGICSALAEVFRYQARGLKYRRLTEQPLMVPGRALEPQRATRAAGSVRRDLMR